MSRSRKLADLLDVNGDVKSANLDNVPSSTDASALTSGTLPIARIADDAVTADKLANSINSEITANTAKTGITTSQANAITANTAKVTNATHTGDVTGATELTIADDAVTADKLANSINTEIAANTAKTGITTSQANAITANTAKVTNATHTGDVTGATALTIAAGAVDIAMMSATGTASSTTYLRGDNAWSTVSSGATGGGTDQVFVENSQTITTDYTIPSGKSASCTGPITMNSGVDITLSAGSRWVIL